jgi:iron complex transport system ATP-binding protein
MSSQTVFSCERLDVRVPGRLLVKCLELHLEGGQILAVLGQNGAGKSLTLHTLAGLRAPAAGSIALNGVALDRLRRRHVAQHLALLPQYTEDVFPATVLDTVLIGRHPHIGRFQWESSRDKRIALNALAQMDIGGMSARDVTTLSGGERRRAAIAQVLTQAPDVYILDEPINHLDPQHQLDVLRLFADKADSGAVVIVSLHDVNLASRFAHQCLLLFGDGRSILGDTDSVLNEEQLTSLYQTRFERARWRDSEIFIAAG